MEIFDFSSSSVFVDLVGRMMQEDVFGRSRDGEEDRDGWTEEDR